MKKEKIVKIAVANFFAISAANILLPVADALAVEQMEKCYGIVKAGMNDCQTATASCAGSAIKDKQEDAFLLMPPGTCNKIVGGSLKPNTSDKVK